MANIGLYLTAHLIDCSSIFNFADGPANEVTSGSPGSNQEINSATLRFKLEPSPMETNGMSCIAASTEGSSDRVTVKQELEQVIKALSQGEETPT